MIKKLKYLSKDLRNKKQHKPRFAAGDLLKYIGPGLLVTVGFIDPGNWATNLAADSDYEYSLLCNSPAKMSGIALSRNVRVRPENNGITIKFEIPINNKESWNANKPDNEPKRTRTTKNSHPDQIR